MSGFKISGLGFRVGFIKDQYYSMIICALCLAAMLVTLASLSIFAIGLVGRERGEGVIRGFEGLISRLEKSRWEYDTILIIFLAILYPPKPPNPKPPNSPKPYTILYHTMLLLGPFGDLPPAEPRGSSRVREHLFLPTAITLFPRLPHR